MAKGKKKPKPTPGRVHLHVGLPKSGTTFVQSTLHRNRALLAERGTALPEGEAVMVDAALDVRGEYDGFGRDPAQTRGTFARVAEQAREQARQGNDVVLSHELFGAATAEQAAAALALLAPLEVHVVVTARDPARQVLAEWQEGIKHGRRLRFEKFARTVLPALDASTDLDSLPDRVHARRFRGAQDLPSVLERWGRDLPPEHVHVVTAPPRGGDHGLLWQRFAEATRIAADGIEPAGREHGNSSLGTTEIGVLRRVNRTLHQQYAGVLDRATYGRTVKRLFAQQLLAEMGSARPVLPAALVDPLRDRAEQWAKTIESAGWTVHGDLADLLPADTEDSAPPPDDVAVEDLLDSALAGTAGLLVRLSAEQDRVRELQHEVERLRRKRRKLRQRIARLGD